VEGFQFLVIRTNHLINKTVGFYGPIAHPVPNAPELRSQHDVAQPVQLQYSGERRAAAAMPLPESP